MFQIFTDFATWLVYECLSLSPATKLGEAIHFFVEDVSKIFVLLLVMILHQGHHQERHCPR